MKKLFYASLLLLLGLLAATAYAQEETPEATPELTFPAPGSFSAQQRAGGILRDYEIYMPQNYQPDSDPLAMVIILHGAGGSGVGIESFAGFDALADEEGFIVIYPDSTIYGWNDNRGDMSAQIDDLLFMERIIDYFVENVNVDPARVYVGGFSRGGMLAYRIGCKLRHKIAGIVSVSSGLPWYLLNECGAADPIPVLMIHGTEDNVIYYEGMQGYLSARETADFWLERNQCEQPADLIETIDEISNDPTSVEIETYNQCAGEAEVTLYTVTGGGHTWPGHIIQAPFDLGTTSMEIDAAVVMWEFFQRHTLPADIEPLETESP